MFKGDLEGEIGGDSKGGDFSDSPEAKFLFPFGFDLDLAWGLSILDYENHDITIRMSSTSRADTASMLTGVI